MSAPAWLDATDPWLTDKMRVDVTLNRYERDVLAAVVEAMTAYLDIARRQLLDDGRESAAVTAAADDGRSQGAPPNLDHFPDEQLWYEEMRKAGVPALLGQLFAEMYGRIRDSAAGMLATLRDSYVAQAIARLGGFPRKVYTEVQAEITAGLAAGESVRQIRARVAALLTMSAPTNAVRAEAQRDGWTAQLRDQVAAMAAAGEGIWQQWAKRIARTETGGAANAGTYSGGETSPRLLAKTWWTRGDSRVRETHQKARGQTQAYGAPFMVGGSALMYPCDPNGAPSEVINCRCMLEIHEADAAELSGQIGDNPTQSYGV